MEQEKRPGKVHPQERTKEKGYGLDRGVESIVAMDNPDDSQLGAERQGDAGQPRPDRP